MNEIILIEAIKNCTPLNTRDTLRIGTLSYSGGYFKPKNGKPYKSESPDSACTILTDMAKKAGSVIYNNVEFKFV